MSVQYNYCTGHLGAVIPSLRRAFGQYARHSSYIKVGIAIDPDKRWGQHQRERRQFCDSWQRMIVLYETSSWDTACQAERWLTRHLFSASYSVKVFNDRIGGAGRRPVMRAGTRAYVYALLD